MRPFLVCDFDGTVCLADVGDRFFEHFVPRERHGEWAALIEAYDTGRMGSREVMEKECAMVRLTLGDALAFADGFRAEPSFASLVAACRSKDVGLAVVSDGLDVYIRRILDNAGLPDVPVLANLAVFRGDVLRPEFPWAGRGCGRCGNCKGGHVEELKAAYSPVVMIGDAHSDVCGALAADRVFAREILSALMKDRGRPTEHYDDFDDVARALGLQGEVRA